MDWIELSKDRKRWRAFLNPVLNLRVQQGAEDFLNGRGTVSFSKRVLLHGVMSHASVAAVIAPKKKSADAFPNCCLACSKV